MLLSLGLTVTLILMIAFAHLELRSALCGITLSNGVEVLVSPEVYAEIVYQYGTYTSSDYWNRWDQAVLKVLRLTRPNECRYLALTLGQSTRAKARSREFVHA